MPSYLTIFILLLLISCCESDDRLTHAKPLYSGDVLVSKGGVFALGFFSPTSSNTSSYLGIWYHGIPGRTVVWIANRDNPIADLPSSVLAMTNSSGLVLSDSQGRRALCMVESSNAAEGTGAAAAAVLLDTGNLVVRLPNGTDVWQSFDHPTDTVLPSMRLMVSNNHRAAKAMGRLVAWNGPGDPSSGDFSCGGDPSSGLQIITWHGASPYHRFTVFNGMTVSDSIYQGVIISSIVTTNRAPAARRASTTTRSESPTPRPRRC